MGSFFQATDVLPKENEDETILCDFRCDDAPDEKAVCPLGLPVPGGEQKCDGNDENNAKLTSEAKIGNEPCL